MQNQSSLMVCLGYGYSASFLAQRLKPKGWRVVGTSRSAKSDDFAEVIEPEAAQNYLPQADAVLVSVPPGEGQDWALKLCKDTVFTQLKWLGYLSSTGVYGDHQGEWVDEQTPPKPCDSRSHDRLNAEHQWQSLALPIHVFRLAGIYGLTRNALAQLKAGIARRIVKEGHYFSRIHVEDIARALEASLENPRSGSVYNLADDRPAPSHEVMKYAANLLGVEPPEEETYDEQAVSPMMRSFYSANRRVSNQKLKQELGIELAYPTYEEGLTALAKELKTSSRGGGQ